MNGMHHGKDLADAAIKAIEQGALSSANPSKSTLIIHSVQRVSTNLYFKKKLNQTIRFDFFFLFFKI